MDVNNEKIFDPTPKLKSSPVPILFIPFNKNEDKCIYCGHKYSNTLSFNHQKYCKNCLFWYIKYIADDNTYLDVHIVTNNTRCIEHEATRNTDYCTRNIQEWCDHCSNISYFRQTISQLFIDRNQVNDCKLCGKLIYKDINYELKLCSDCYLITYEWVESTLVKNPILIIYLPWWDNNDECVACIRKLSFVSNCQKWCSNCYLIYSGCRYCLTTNIIFGITNQSQCKKCKRVSTISITISSGDHDIDEILNYINFGSQIDQIDMNNLNNLNSNCVYNFVRHNTKPKVKWIPYSQIKILTKIAEGGFGIVYKATFLDGKTVAIKKFFNSQNISKYFLNEVITFLYFA
jgi:hypothetical protein